MWRSPQWFVYTLAIVLSCLTLAIRWRLQEVLEGRGALIFCTFAVCVSALIGGLWPGLVATAIGLVGGVAIMNASGNVLATTEGQIQVTAFAAIWTFIALTCDGLRRMAQRSSDTAKAQEVQRHRLETILSSITDGFFAVDRDWRITASNAAFQRLAKRNERELAGKEIWDVLTGPANYELRVKLVEAKREGEPIAIDVPYPDGVCHHLRAFPNADGMFVYVQDISDRRHLEAQRDRLLTDERIARNEAEIASRLKDDFVATLSHELRTPLTTMLGWTEILQLRNAEDPEMLEGLLSIERSARHQAELIDDLLEMSRVMTGKLKLDLEYVSLSELVFEAVDSLRPTAESKGVNLSVEQCPEDDVVRVDAKRMFQVLTNLGSNAIKFTPSGGNVAFKTSRVENTMCVTVKDDGEGIDPTFMPFLFDRFRQANPSITRQHGGLGLGLAIVKQLTELHGGTVTASSEGVGKGSSFDVCLPINPASRREGLGGSKVEPDAAAMKGLKILLVDDDPGTLEVVKIILSEFGAICTPFSSPRDALAALEGESFDLLLSDIGMPDLDGYAFLSKVRELPNGQLPAIAFTAFATAQDRERALAAGFQAHLAKPIDMHRLIEEVSRTRSLTG